MTKRGISGKGRWSEGCRRAGHGQILTKERTVAVSERAQLELGVKLRQGHEVKRQAENANLVTQCFMHAMARMFLCFVFILQLMLSQNTSLFATPQQAHTSH
jgi:hypothetical protein